MTFGGLPDSHIPAAIEALLFVSDEPVGALVLADMLEVDVKTVQKALDVLRERLSDEESGVQLREVAGGWRLYTHPRYHALIEKYVISWDTRRLPRLRLKHSPSLPIASPSRARHCVGAWGELRQPCQLLGREGSCAGGGQGLLKPRTAHAVCHDAFFSREVRPRLGS